MYSFDVFDTLITRRTGTPKGIYALIQKKLNICKDYRAISRYIAVNFYELRIHAEELARVNNQKNEIEEISLDEIYIAMASTGCLSSDEQQILSELEITTELENVVGIEENIKRIKELISQDEEVILISDMYLDKHTIRKMLMIADPIFEDIPLFVSSEFMQRKTSGNLYRAVKEKLNLSYSEWLHVGDNPYQDIVIPIELGITVEQYMAEPLSGFEEELLKNYGANPLLQLTIGASRIAKLNSNIVTDAERIGSSLGGPILYYYAEWILEKCVMMNIKRLYFIARDGYLIKSIVEKLIKYKGVEIDTYYIYGSRRAWRIPSLTREDFNLKQIIQWSNKHLIKTIEDLTDVLMLDLKEIYPYLPKGCRRASVKLTEQTIDYLVQGLEKNNSFKDYYLTRLSPTRDLARGYLQQEIDFIDDDFAFVDLAGGGLTQGCLKKLLKGIYDKPIRTFFYKMDRVNLMDGCIYDVFLPSFLKNSLVLEMVSRAPHGQTTGYRIDDGRFVPIIDEMEEEAILNHGFMDYKRGIESFVQGMAEFRLDKNFTIGNIDMIIKYINYIAERPDDISLNFFASFPSGETGREEDLLEYAPKLSREDLDNIYLKRSTEYLEDYYKGSYLDYSILRCSREDLEYIERCKNEFHSARGKLLRQNKLHAERSMMRTYGSAGRFPCEILERDIIIYGAGKFGQGLYKKIINLGFSNVIQWVDKDYIRYNESGLDMVESPMSIGAKEYEQIVIAVANHNLAKAIKRELISMGIPEEKMIWMDTNPYMQNYLN